MITAYAAGYGIRFKKLHNPILQMMGHMLCGILILTIGTWLATLFYIPHKQLIAITTVFLLLWRRRPLKRAARNIRRLWIVHSQASPALILAGFFVFTLFFVYSAQPITSSDALTKHLAIPAKILAYGHYDYNIIESLVFAGTSLMLHMSGVWLMTLGATKGLVFFVSAMGLSVLMLILLMLRKSTYHPVFASTLAVLLFGFTPLTLQLSTIYYQDILPLPFIFFVICFITTAPKRAVAHNIHTLLALIGGAYFGKQTAFYLGGPTALAALIVTARAVQLRQISYSLAIGRVLLGCILLVSAMAGPILIIWHKTGNPMFPFMNNVFQSEYFPPRAFKDEFKNPLGLNFTSLLSLVFQTDRNMEISAGGLGMHLLLMPAALLVPLIRRDRKWIIISAVCLAGYVASTLATYNIRYFLAAFTLTIPITAYALDSVIQVIPHKIKALTKVASITLLIIPCIHFIFISDSWSMVKFKSRMLFPDDRFYISPMSDALDSIADQSSSVFFNCKRPLRGAYPGYVSSAGWHNTHLMLMLRKKEITTKQLIEFFDFVIEPTDKAKQALDLTSLKEKKILLPQHRDSSYSLYRVRPAMEALLKLSFDEGLTVTSGRSYRIDNPGKAIRLVIESEAHSPKQYGRFQVSWRRVADNSAAGLTLIPFLMKEGRHVYLYDLDNPFTEPVYGMVYLNSHDKRPVTIYSYQVLHFPKPVLTQVLEKYDETWPRARRSH